MWLEDAIKTIRQIKSPVYFVCEDANARYPLAIVKLPPKFRERLARAWRRLTKEETFRLHLYKAWDDKLPEGDWYVVGASVHSSSILTLT